MVSECVSERERVHEGGCFLRQDRISIHENLQVNFRSFIPTILLYIIFVSIC
jgi:hypothetical protein